MCDKPPLPYVKGWRFKVRSHTPAPPTPVFRFCCTNDEDDRKEYDELHPVDRCLRQPPLKGSKGSFTVDLEIDDTLQVGDTNAQVVIVNVINVSPFPLLLAGEELARQKRVVAKIYDPLYFPDDYGYLNPFICVDKHYTHETEAYSKLSDLQGIKIPKYYGSYTLCLPVERPQDEKPRRRRIRLILIEFIPGKAMQDIRKPKKKFSEADRQRIMKEIVDIETNMYTHDIRHGDIHPRNIIVRSTKAFDADSTTPINTRRNFTSVTAIDFGAAEFGRLGMYPPKPELDAKFFPGVYISPLLRWHKRHDRTDDFQDWIDWDWQTWLEAEYAHTEAFITPEIRKRFLPDYLFNPPADPAKEEYYARKAAREQAARDNTS